MEDIGFDLANILTEEEAAKLFNESDTGEDNNSEQEKPEEIEKTDNTPAEEEDETQPSEKVGEGDKHQAEEDAAQKRGDGSSPDTFFSSIADALKKDGILSDLDDKDIESVKTADDFAQLFEKIVEARENARTKRVNDLLDGGVEPESIKKYEQTIAWLDDIEEDALTAEGEQGENLRKSLIYNDLISRKYSPEKARKEVEKSFKSGSDVDDAKDALSALKTFYSESYNKLQEDAKKRVEDERNRQKAEADKFKKTILEDELKFGDTVLDKKTCQRVYDSVMRPSYKDPETGQYLTQVQKFQKDNPLEFLKQLGLWYVLTDGGKNVTGIIKDQVRVEKNKNIRELERKINTTAFNTDGTLKYAGSQFGDGDPLLDDGWKIDV